MAGEEIDGNEQLSGTDGVLVVGIEDAEIVLRPVAGDGGELRFSAADPHGLPIDGGLPSAGRERAAQRSFDLPIGFI